MSDVWSVVYKKAINDDGSLLFPERLTRDFLDKARRTMGSYLFANQYQNEVVPADERRFKPEWFKYYDALPETKFTFGFIDPAIGQDKHHDYTGIVIVDVDPDGAWFVRVANRYRLTPTQIVSKMFELQEQFNLRGLGVEVVAYQEALLYLVSEEIRKRQKILPVKGIRRAAISKETRILGLVPRFEWGQVYLNRGLTHLEDELTTFPRGSFDDLLDSLASLEEIVSYPPRKVERLEKPHDPNDPRYEKWFIQNLAGRQGGQDAEY